MVVELIAAVLSAGALYFVTGARVVQQFERGVVFRLGRVRGGVRGPGFTMVVPVVDRMRKVNLQIVTMPVPAQEGITRDNVTVRVDAVVYFKVVNAADAIINVEDYRFAVSQMAQTSLRSIIGKSDLDDLLSNREKLNQGLELMIDSPAIGWGVQIDRVEIKDVSLPETMKRSMARQAESERERRARIINADAEFQASKKLAEAAHVMGDAPAALQLRLLQTVVAVAAEKNSALSCRSRWSCCASWNAPSRARAPPPPPPLPRCRVSPRRPRLPPPRLQWSRFRRMSRASCPTRCWRVSGRRGRPTPSEAGHCGQECRGHRPGRLRHRLPRGPRRYGWAGRDVDGSPAGRRQPGRHAA